MGIEVLMMIVRILVGLVITAFLIYVKMSAGKDAAQDQEIGSLKSALNNRPTRQEVEDIIKGAQHMTDRLTDSHRDHCEFRFDKVEKSIEETKGTVERLREKGI